MGSSGAVAWMFDRKGIISVDADKISEDDLLEKALEAGAPHARRVEKAFEITTAPAQMDAVRDAPARAGLPIPEGLLTHGPQSLENIAGTAAPALAILI